MANAIRGEAPFTVRGGEERFICYGTREIAEVQSALGFRRPDSQQPDVVEEIDEPIFDTSGPKEVGAGMLGVPKQKTDGKGRPVFRRTRVLVDAKERQRRMIAGFNACLLNPDPEAVLTFFRIGLGPWQRKLSVKLDHEAIMKIVDSLGLTRIQLLHQQALSLGCYLFGDEIEADEGKAQGAASVSSI